jgi:tRNA (guanine37-N1)-methyltransferase
LSCASRQNARNIAKTIISVHKNVKTVLAQISPVAGDFRLRRLAHVLGENRTSTIHSESGCLFSVDVEKCYFSPRLYYERSRIATLVKPDETVVNMFAGVGCFSIIIAKHTNTAKVFSIDVNPAAIQFMRKNIMLNRVYGNVIPLLGDSKAIIESQLQRCADRVLMPLPEKAFEYLPCAVSALKASGGWMHVHAFEHAMKTENPAEKVKLKVAEKLDALDVDFEVPFVRVVRSTGPNWFQLVADVHVM